jgi:hypothetical protein
MIERGGRAGFAAKSLKGLRVLRHILRKKLQSDEAAQLGVFRFVDHAHSTTAEFFDDAVMRDSLTNERVSAGHVPQILGWRQDASQRSGTDSRFKSFHEPAALTGNGY